jgi:hypothetical protein
MHESNAKFRQCSENKRHKKGQHCLRRFHTNCRWVQWKLFTRKTKMLNPREGKSSKLQHITWHRRTELRNFLSIRHQIQIQILMASSHSLLLSPQIESCCSMVCGRTRINKRKLQMHTRGVDNRTRIDGGERRRAEAAASASGCVEAAGRWADGTLTS